MKGKLKIDPLWSKSKEEIWQERFGFLPERVAPSQPARSFFYRPKAIAVAAVVILLLVAFPALYTVKKTASAGEYIKVELPDGSDVTMNSGTEIKYRPLLWLLSRNLSLKGEAFFSVKKGSRFTVKTSQGFVSVLGTKFNVYSREDRMSVFCSEGKVEIKERGNSVKSNGLYKVVVTPGQSITIDKLGKVTRFYNSSRINPSSWTEGTLSFEAIPLSSVLKEICRIYNVKISYNAPENYIYSGNFKRNLPVEQVLEIVTKPFSLNFVIEKEEYIISGN